MTFDYFDFRDARERMVAEQLEGRGFRNEPILAAMRRVPRHLFVPARQEAIAYDDCPLQIGEGQTISQPYMVAVMTEALGVGVGARVLEIGTGSGYQAAILGELGAEVVTVERKPALAAKARERLASLGYSNVEVVVGDGSLGYPASAPYDGIVVTAGAPQVPASLTSQLADGARLVVPIGQLMQQELRVIERRGLETRETGRMPCAFVPLIGKLGWPER
jgi:protein-L-isoaspartate(D-aspartate) O-methyltransferase